MVALADKRDRMQADVAAILRDEPGELVIPELVCAEVDYLLGSRLGRPARLAFLTDLRAGRFITASLERDDYGVIATLESKYADLDAGLTELSVVVIAARRETSRLLTFDERHFRPLRTLDGKQFVLLPADDQRA